MINLIKRLFKRREKKPVKSYNELILEVASKEIGVAEIPGDAENPRIQAYHKWADEGKGVHTDISEEVPWCSSFICFCYERIGLPSTDSRLARSWLKWGRSSRTGPIPGDVCVKWRQNPHSWQGHTFIFLGFEGRYVWGLGGNQKNKVSVKKFETRKVLDIRRANKQEDFTTPQKQRLAIMAYNIINGKPAKV